LQAQLKLEEIVKGCLDGDKKSQHNFYVYFYAFCFSACETYCKTHDDAEEVVNDGFFKIFKNLHNFNARYDNFEGSLYGWIKRIMINTAIDHCQKSRKRYSFCEINDEAFRSFTPEQSAIDKLSHSEILKLVLQLSPSCQLVFSLHSIVGFKHREIAKKLNISVGTSKSNLAKARVNIQKMMQFQSKNGNRFVRSEKV